MSIVAKGTRVFLPLKGWYKGARQTWEYFSTPGNNKKILRRNGDQWEIYRLLNGSFWRHYERENQGGKVGNRDNC